MLRLSRRIALLLATLLPDHGRSNTTQFCLVSPNSPMLYNSNFQRRTMNIVIIPSRITGTIQVPPSKSHSLRAILFASLASGVSSIENYLDSPDARAMLSACSQMGASLDQFNTTSLKIQGTVTPIFSPGTKLYTSTSGIVLRFMTALAALQSREISFEGDEQLSRRPMRPLLEFLIRNGASIRYPTPDRFWPFTIQTPLSPQHHYGEIEGSDSQFVSALIIAGACAKHPFRFRVNQPKEIPWIRLTLDWLQRLNIPYETNDHFSYFHIRGNHSIHPFHYRIPGDWSSASFPAAAALLSHRPITLNDLSLQDAQGDQQAFHIWKSWGARIQYHSNYVQIHPSPQLAGGDVDMDACIDALPIMTVMACFASKPTYLYNATAARYKESNRLLSITHELRKMGAKIAIHADGLSITPTILRGADLDSHHDHRIAMALIVAALHAQGPSTLTNINCINKTYPNFIQTLSSLGGHIVS